LDEVVISIAGKQHWLWRAIDQDGYVEAFPLRFGPGKDLSEPRN
jgi:transposase-like protein